MIKIAGVSKKFNSQTIFNNLDFEILDGAFVFITGQSGSGKSTLLNMIGSLESCDSGDIEIEQRNVKSFKSSMLFRYTVTYIFQNYGLVEEESVRQNLLPTLVFTKANKKEKEELIQEALTKVSMESKIEQPVFTLSGGEQQRVAIAKAILKPSKIILADEPTGNLDVENTKKIMDLFRYMNEVLKKTVVIVTHDLSLIKPTDVVLNLESGTVTHSE